MAKTVEDAISDLVAEITAEEAETRKKKDTVNTLCGVAGRPPVYAEDVKESVVSKTIRSDQFYGQPLATSVRQILEMRKAANKGAASNNEIYDALTAGGYQFQTKSEDIAKNSLRNSLAKNNTLFHKLPNGTFGLVSWYPNVRAARASTSNRDANEADDTASPEDETGMTEDR